MQVGRSAVELSVYALLSVIRRENLGDPHPVLTGGAGYVSPRFAGDAEQWLRAELAEAGLTDHGLVTDFFGMLSIIQSARIEFYGWVADSDGVYAVLVAAHGRNAFALTRRGDRVRIQRVASERLAEALVDRLPEAPAGRGESISVRESELSRSGPRPVLRGKPRSEQVRRLDALFRARRHSAAKLYAACRDDTDDRVRASAWLSLIDIVDGRWAVYATTGRGERVINAVAANPALVSAKLTDLLRTAR